MKPLLPVMKEKVSFGTQLFNAFILTFFVAISPLTYFFLFCFFLWLYPFFLCVHCFFLFSFNQLHQVFQFI